MHNTHSHNEELNKQIRNVQSRIDKINGFQESQQLQIEQAKKQALSIFGTDDVLLIKEQVGKIEERNQKVIAFKNRVLSLSTQIIDLIEKKEPVPEALLADLEKALEASNRHVAALNKAN